MRRGLNGRSVTIRKLLPQGGVSVTTRRPWRRPSPMTSLEYCGGSGASESCSKEFLTKRSEIGGVPSIAGSETKMVVAGERELFRIPDSKPFRRSLARKKSTLPELEAMHQSLLEHRKFLLKKMEGKRRSKVVLVAKNRELKELKMRLEPQKRPNTAPLPEEELPQRVRLPDLNVPLVPESD